MCHVLIPKGWGKNDDGKLNTDYPKKVNVPIVSDGTCLRAHEAFVHITSDRTFCAGGRNGEGPCQGDSKDYFLKNVINNFMEPMFFRRWRNSIKSWKEMVY